MLKTIFAILAIAFLPSLASAEDFKTSQHNFKFKSGAFDGEIRQTLDSDKDHIQLGYTINDLNIQFRHVDSANEEKRVRATYKLFENDNFYFRPRVEFRHFQSSDDYWRIRQIIGVKHKFDNVKVYAEFQPSWNLGKQGSDDDFKMDSGQFKIGSDVKLSDKVSFGPFIQLDTDKHFNKQDMFIGTNLEIKF